MKANRSTWISVAAAFAICVIAIIWQRNGISAMRGEIAALEKSLAAPGEPGVGDRRRLSSALTTSGGGDGNSRHNTAQKPKSAENGKATPRSGRRAIEEILAIVPSQENGPEAAFRSMPKLLEAFADYSSEELIAAVEAIDQLAADDKSKSEVAGFAKAMLLMVLAEGEPERVLQMIDEGDTGGQDEFRIMAFAALVRKDPARARAVLSDADWQPYHIQQAKSSLVSELVKADVPQALEFMRANPSGIRFMSNAVIGIATGDDAVRANLWAAMEVEEDKVVREALAKGLITGEFLRGGLSATREAFDKAKFLDAALKRSIIDETAGEAICTDPDATYAWIREALAPDEVDGALASAVRSWAQKDFNAAGIWLGKQAKSPGRDAAIGAFANTVVRIDPLAAVAWAAEIEDEDTRRSAIQTTLRHWSVKDADAARSWMRDNGVDEPGTGVNEPAPGETKE